MRVLLENWFFLLIALICIGMHVFGHGHGHGHGRGQGGHAPSDGKGPQREPHHHGPA